MEITHKQLSQIIKEELNRLNEGMSVDTMEDLQRVLRVAYEEGRTSYSPDQIVAGIPGKTEDRPVDPDPHIEVVNTLTPLMRSILDDFSDDGSGLAARDPESITPQDMADAKRHAGYEPEAQAKYLGITIEDWHVIRKDMDDWYEERHMLDQGDWEEELDTDGDGNIDYDEIS